MLCKQKVVGFDLLFLCAFRYMMRYNGTTNEKAIIEYPMYRRRGSMSEEERSMIAIVSADHKNIIGCHSIKTSTILAPGKGRSMS